MKHKFSPLSMRIVFWLILLLALGSCEGEATPEAAKVLKEMGTKVIEEFAKKGLEKGFEKLNEEKKGQETAKEADEAEKGGPEAASSAATGTEAQPMEDQSVAKTSQTAAKEGSDANSPSGKGSAPPEMGTAPAPTGVLKPRPKRGVHARV